MLQDAYITRTTADKHTHGFVCVLSLPKSFLIEDRCRFLSNFSLSMAEIEIPGEFLNPKSSSYFVRISRFMPRVQIVNKHNVFARRLFIRGDNGKIYPYLFVNHSNLLECRREETVLQMLRLLDDLFDKHKETARRRIVLNVPRVVALSPQMRFIQDNPASLSLMDIYKKKVSDPDLPVSRFYERLAWVQSRGSQPTHQMLCDVLKDIQNTLVPRTLVRDWAIRTFPSACHFWTFRKQLTVQMALVAFCEYVLHLTRTNPDMLFIHQDSGFININYYCLDVNESQVELQCQRPVPFRLTPNLVELMSVTGVQGVLSQSLLAICRCLADPHLKVTSMLKAVVKDEIISALKRKEAAAAAAMVPMVSGSRNGAETVGGVASNVQTVEEGEATVNWTTKAVVQINNRLNGLASLEKVSENNVSKVVNAAASSDNVCRMDPAWQPWL